MPGDAALIQEPACGRSLRADPPALLSTIAAAIAVGGGSTQLDLALAEAGLGRRDVDGFATYSVEKLDPSVLAADRRRK